MLSVRRGESRHDEGAGAQTSKAPMPVSVRCRRGGRSSTVPPWLFNTLLITSSFCPGSMEQVLKTRRPPSGLSSESAVSISRNCVFASRLSRPLDQFSAAAPQRRMTWRSELQGASSRMQSKFTPPRHARPADPARRLAGPPHASKLCTVTEDCRRAAGR